MHDDYGSGINLRWQIAQFFELRWWRNYLKSKQKSNYLDWKKKYWSQFLSQISYDPVPDSRVLDAGCGPAGIFTVLEQHRVDAIDPLLEAYGQQLSFFTQQDYPWVKFIGQKLEDYYPDKTYDTIFCLNAINHVANLEQGMNRLWHLLKPDGWLVLSVDAHNYRLLRKLFQIFPGDILHPHQYLLVEYENFLLQHGFVLENKVLIKKAGIFSYWVLRAKRKGL